MYWGSRASSVAMQFAIPPGIGYWVDTRYDCEPIGVCIGAVIGFASGLIQLMNLVKRMENADRRRKLGE